MTDRLISKLLLWLLAASAAGWLLLSIFEKSLWIAERFVSDPGFPAKYGSFLILVVVLADFITMAVLGLAVSSGSRSGGLFRRETDGIRGDMDEIRKFVGMGSQSG